MTIKFETDENFLCKTPCPNRISRAGDEQTSEVNIIRPVASQRCSECKYFDKSNFNTENANNDFIECNFKQ